MLWEPGERLDGLARDVIGAALAVHRTLGPGFPEGIYEDALALELKERSIPFERQVSLAVQYKGSCVGEWRADLLVGGALVVELKAVEQLATVHVAQVVAYLKAIDCRLGLLINFDVPVLREGIRRVVQSSR
jgi:GxxExxY protein